LTIARDPGYESTYGGTPKLLAKIGTKFLQPPFPCLPTNVKNVDISPKLQQKLVCQFMQCLKRQADIRYPGKYGETVGIMKFEKLNI
jgi:hypothetical protein